MQIFTFEPIPFEKKNNPNYNLKIENSQITVVYSKIGILR